MTTMIMVYDIYIYIHYILLYITILRMIYIYIHYILLYNTKNDNDAGNV